jgi:HAD superfamily hydrolase (TIGR01490 family)
MEAAFFDLDKTVISRASAAALSRPMYQAGFVTRRMLLRAAYGQLVFELLGANEKRVSRAKEALLALSRGWEQAEVEKIVRRAIVDVIDPYVYEEALDLIASHREQGRRVFIVSSSPEEIVGPLADHFGVDGVIATRAEIEDGRYTGRLAFYCFGESKADRIRELAEREGLDLDASFAYSDSETDLPMLEVVGNPVAVNPSRELRRIAESRRWETRDFRRRVLMRPEGERSHALDIVATAVVASLAALVVLGALARARHSRHRSGDK